MSFLHDSCRTRLCMDCKESVGEYERLLINYKQRNAELERGIDRLRGLLGQARQTSDEWKKLAMLGYPDVIQKWMDSLVKEAKCEN